MHLSVSNKFNTQGFSKLFSPINPMIPLFPSHLFYMGLHLKRCVELSVAVFTLCEVTQINVLLFTGVYVTLYVHHCLDVVIQHLIAVPTL